MTAQKEYIITEDGMNELDKYFSEHHDGLIHIAWKNLKDKFIRPAKESSNIPGQCPFCNTHENNLFACYKSEQKLSCSYIKREEGCPILKSSDKVLDVVTKRFKESFKEDPAEWTQQQIIYLIEQVRVELRQQKEREQ